MNPTDVPAPLIGMGPQPLQVQAVRVELPAGGGHQTPSAFGDDFVDRGLDIV